MNVAARKSEWPVAIRQGCICGRARGRHVLGETLNEMLWWMQNRLTSPRPIWRALPCPVYLAAARRLIVFHCLRLVIAVESVMRKLVRS